MARSSIAQAQRDWLRGELNAWQTRGIINAKQARQILDQYESPEEDSQRKRSRAVQALLGMAAFLFGLAVLLLIGFNWEAMPRAAKVAVVLAVVAGTHALGFGLRYRWEQPRLSEVVFFLGCLFYGAGIWLVAQAFHLSAHYPDGVWWWAVGVLPFALGLESLLLHLLLVGLLATWAGMEAIGFPHHSPWWLLGQIPNGAYSLPLLALPGLVWAARRASPVGVGLYVPLFAWWVVLQSFAWGAGERSVFLIGTAGAALLILAEAHRPGNAMAIPYRLWGTALSAGSLIPLSSWSFWEAMRWPRRLVFNDPDFSLTGIGVEFALLVTMLGASVALLVSRRGRSAGISEAVGRSWFPLALGGGLTVTAAWSLMSQATDSALRLVPVVLANLAMLGLALYLLRVGVREDRVRPFAFGILYFLVWAFVRYFDLFAETGGMLGAAALFALCAAGLVVIARFWGRARGAAPEEEPPRTKEPEFTGPRWLDRVAAWAGPRQRAILMGTAALHLAVLGGMIAVESLPLWYGTRVLLRVRPVDPRDLFRGDYVILSYDLGPPNGWRWDAGPGRVVYVRLEPDEDGRHWRAAGFGPDRPSGGVYLRGRDPSGAGRPEFGIEAYYVQEGKGVELERLRNARRLSAEVAVAPWGKAKLVRLIPEG